MCNIMRIARVFVLLFLLTNILKLILLDFYELLPEIKQTIKASVFLAIDGEFTGLNTGQEVHGCETPDSYYAKLRNSSLEFLFIQFGLAAFFYNSTTDK